jgi:polar amino acid transport system substrate-binding protein
VSRFVSASRLSVATVTLAALALTACSSSGGKSPSDSGSGSSGAGNSAIPNTSSIVGGVSKNAALAASLPASIKGKGTLTVGSNVQSPPNNFYGSDGKTPVGFEVDLITAVAGKLGMKVKYQDMGFDSLITSLASGRIDTTIAGMNDTKEREQKIDFVDYFSSGITIMVRKGNPQHIDNSMGLCGKKIAVVTGTTQEDFAKQQSTTCRSSDKSALQLTATDSDSQNQTQLRTGRVDAILNDLPTAVYISRTAGGGKYFQVVPQAPINGAPYGIGVAKTNKALATAMQQALQELIDDGTYRKILSAWRVTSGALSKATINGG